MATESRFAHRPLDQRGPRADVCPTCGGERQELLVAVDRFYCETCKVATEGPNTTPPEEIVEPLALFSVSDVGQDAPVEERPPIDDYDLEPTDDVAR